MNGTLHAGHTFSISKVEFASGVARMQGKRALFPLGFHCTGMPIKACADKLVDEIAMFGREFERYKAEPEEVLEVSPEPTSDDAKAKSSKSKANAKTIKAKYQFQIMESIGIPRENIHRFADPQFWLTYFPPLAMEDLTAFGCRIDWRRSFVTTDANPYYDAFVRWQMNRLKELERVKFGKRHTIYSIKDGQPCMDHDRAEGEGVNPQEYTAVKLKVEKWSENASTKLKSLLSEAPVFLVSATLRPETVYGLSSCFVGPAIEYGLYKVKEDTYYLMTDHAARNMAYQGIFAENGVIEKAASILGADIVGTHVTGPLTSHTEGFKVLPAEIVVATKGTGVVMSVPSDSPHDYITMVDLAKKADFYGIDKSWVNLDILPIINTPTYGNLCAPAVVEALKITSQRDVKQLETAKELAYKEGFYHGTMCVGEFKGESVESAKPKVREKMIEANDAFMYAEPESKVISRSGDICIVAWMDQWYLDYGEETWKQKTLKWVEGMQTWAQETKNGLEAVLNWLNQWACARSFGLGSKLPWDPRFVVESLSDSTIYMAYYTIAHFLHKDLFGRTKGSANIDVEQMTDEVWDYVFCRRELDVSVEKSGIPRATLQSMRREFEYFYPLDMRTSGKDLISNHLTFFLYIHVALFPPEYWPRGIRANGHLLLNGKKMSKSTGNFLTLKELISKYGSDASRIAMADAGDGIGDANFEEDIADNNVLRLYGLREWCEEMARDSANLRTDKNGFQDALFDNDIRVYAREAMGQYAETNYKLALKAALYGLLGARDFYRESCAAAGIQMNKDLIMWYIEVQTLVLAVITPHWSEYIWLEVLRKESTIHNARFPEVPEPAAALSAKREYLRTTTSNILSAKGLQLKKKAKGKVQQFDPKKPTRLTIYMTDAFPAWREFCVEVVKELWDVKTKSLDEKELNSRLVKTGEMKKAMPFVQSLKKRLAAGEALEAVTELKLAFSEQETLQQMIPGLIRSAGLKSCEIYLVSNGSGLNIVDGSNRQITSPIAENAVPGSPTFLFENIDA